MAAAVLFFVLFQHHILKNKASVVPRVRHLKWKRISVPFLLKTRRISPKTGREKGKINFIRLVAILWIAWGCKHESIHYNEN